VLSSVIPNLQLGVLLVFVEILMRLKGLGLVSRFQMCNLGGFCKNFNIMMYQAKVALTYWM